MQLIMTIVKKYEDTSLVRGVIADWKCRILLIMFICLIFDTCATNGSVEELFEAVKDENLDDLFT